MTGEMKRLITNNCRNSKGKMDIAKLSADTEISEKLLLKIQRKEVPLSDDLRKRGGILVKLTVT